MGVGLIIARKNKHSVEEGNFALAGKGLPTAQVGVTLALTMLGSAHIWGTCENAYSMGSIATWFGIACTVMMIVITQITGPWVRKIGTDTMPDLFGKLYGKKMRILCACVMGPLVLDVCALRHSVSQLHSWHVPDGLTPVSYTHLDTGCLCGDQTLVV